MWKSSCTKLLKVVGKRSRAFNVDSPVENEFNVVVTIDEKHASELHIGQHAKVIISKSPQV